MKLIVKRTRAKIVRNGRNMGLYFRYDNEVTQEIRDKSLLVRIVDFDIAFTGKAIGTNIHTAVINIPRKYNPKLENMLSQEVDVELVYYG